MSNQGLKYNVDIVFCIDVTGSMHGILETVKTNALRFYPDLQKSLDEKDPVKKTVIQAQVRMEDLADIVKQKYNLQANAPTKEVLQ